MSCAPSIGQKITGNRSSGIKSAIELALAALMILPSCATSTATREKEIIIISGDGKDEICTSAMIPELDNTKFKGNPFDLIAVCSLGYMSGAGVLDSAYGETIKNELDAFKKGFNAGATDNNTEFTSGDVVPYISYLTCPKDLPTKEEIEGMKETQGDKIDLSGIFSLSRLLMCRTYMDEPDQRPKVNVSFPEEITKIESKVIFVLRYGAIKNYRKDLALTPEETESFSAGYWGAFNSELSKQEKYKKVPMDVIKEFVDNRQAKLKKKLKAEGKDFKPIGISYPTVNEDGSIVYSDLPLSEQRRAKER